MKINEFDKHFQSFEIETNTEIVYYICIKLIILQVYRLSCIQLVLAKLLSEIKQFKLLFK